jgi:hypothetical protein
MDISKQTRDESGKLVTQYESQGPIPVAHQEAQVEARVEAEEAPQAPVAKEGAPLSMKVWPTMRRSAVFVAHGMGQQVRFQTMDDVVGGLSHEDHNHRQRSDSKENRKPRKPQTSTIEHGDERIQRVELSLLRESGEEREVHVFEGYWAPLVEGKVTLRDVIGFFFRTGLNGIRNGASPFKRWVFGKFEEYEVKSDTARYFAVALLVVLSLVIMNFALTGAGVLSPTVGKMDWLSNAIFADLTTIFNIALTGLLFLALPVAVGLALHRMRAARERRERVGKLCWAGLVIALSAIIFSGIVAVPSVLIQHIFWLRNHAKYKDSLFPGRFQGIAEHFNAGLDAALWITVLLGLVFGLPRLARMFFAAKKHRRQRMESPRRGGRMILWLSCLWGLMLIGFWVFSFSGRLPDRRGGGGRYVARSSISWVLLLFASAKIRTALIQYTGDVAAYVSPQVLDRFNELRREIRDCVYRQAAGVYECMENGKFAYDEILIVGHSLGSVVVYDALNRLLAQDELVKNAVKQGDDAAWKRYLNVLGRTKLLLTFGSPLDKTAFVFSLQAQDTSETREALAAEVQPLIKDSRFRTFPWINIWSPKDIFSGELDFYDPPRHPSHNPGPNAVTNIKDKDATTLLLAHVEYWRNPLLFKKLYSRI